VIDGVLTALLAARARVCRRRPGLGKDAARARLSQAIHTGFSRIQFKPYMIPPTFRHLDAVLERAAATTRLRFQEGPLVSNLVLADEINRATPNAVRSCSRPMRSARLTVGRRTLILTEPFLLAGHAAPPVERKGTYPLPEAQISTAFCSSSSLLSTRKRTTTHSVSHHCDRIED